MEKAETQTEDGQQILNKEQIHGLLDRRLNQFRHKNWEDDISRNSIENEPFENQPDISAFKHELEVLRNEQITVDEILAYAANDTAPIPCPEDREMYSARYTGRYWFTGLDDFLKVQKAAAGKSIDIKRYFDFGCASGRVLRHFAFQSQIKELWGSDINARHIRWLCEFMPKTVRPIANHTIAHLPISDNYFDVVTAFSVFTHIDTFETCWLAELRRILRPGGMAYLTVHNDDTWSVLKKELDNPDNRLIESMRNIEPNINDTLNGPIPEGRTVYRFTHKGPYRAQVFHSNRYIENVWGRFFDKIEILPLQHIRQSVVILTKS